jgi:hypothetical protein
MRTLIAVLAMSAILTVGTEAFAEDQVPPTQEEAREVYRTFAYSEAGIREFVTSEFAASKLKVNTEQVIAILVRDLKKDGAGGFRIAPQDFDFTFEYHRVGPNVRVDKVAK